MADDYVLYFSYVLCYVLCYDKIFGWIKPKMLVKGYINYLIC